jgi:hypothetical protein
MEHEGLNVKAALPRFGELVFNDVQVSVVDIDPSIRDLQPGPAVEDPAAPSTDLGDLTLPPKGPEVCRLETIPVIHGEVPIASYLMGTQSPGAPKRY